MNLPPSPASGVVCAPPAPRPPVPPPASEASIPASMPPPPPRDPPLPEAPAAPPVLVPPMPASFPALPPLPLPPLPPLAPVPASFSSVCDLTSSGLLMNEHAVKRQKAAPKLAYFMVPLRRRERYTSRHGFAPYRRTGLVAVPTSLVVLRPLLDPGLDGGFLVRSEE